MSHEARIEKLRSMLKAREGHPVYAENCTAIRAEIARLETRIGINIK